MSDVLLTHTHVDGTLDNLIRAECCAAADIRVSGHHYKRNGRAADFGSPGCEKTAGAEVMRRERSVSLSRSDTYKFV
jgi:hypothetical protein